MSGPTLRVLRVDASARTAGSQSRALVDGFIDDLRRSGAVIEVIRRDLAEMPSPQVDQRWIAANNTLEAERTPDQREALALSDTLIDELRAADMLVLGAPIYNFGLPASLKAWFDLVCRARLTFRYGPDGPEGLLVGKSALAVVTSGGTAVGGPIDFATPHLRHLLGFIGIKDVSLVAADGSVAKIGGSQR